MKYDSEAALLEEATRFLAKWQPILLLQEWQIGVMAVQELKGRRAETAFTNPHHQATMQVCRSYWLGEGNDDQFHHGKVANVSLEETVIHELLHVRLANVEDVMADIRHFTPPHLDEAWLFEMHQVVFLMARIFNSLNGGP